MTNEDIARAEVQLLSLSTFRGQRIETPEFQVIWPDLAPNLYAIPTIQSLKFSKTISARGYFIYTTFYAPNDSDIAVMIQHFSKANDILAGVEYCISEDPRIRNDAKAVDLHHHLNKVYSVSTEFHPRYSIFGPIIHGKICAYMKTLFDEVKL